VTRLNGEETFNTVTTSKGSQYQIILSDGTRVWLNALSSIRFPTAFTKGTREVQVSGEAYLEVTKNSKQPFFVKTAGPEVQVLGTSFNISAYEAESAKTSLLEGSIKVDKQLLLPGQAYKNGQVINTNIEQDIAWKNGIFNLNELLLKEAMNQLARWYNIEIVYDGVLPPFNFYGEMGRDLSLNEMIKILNNLGMGNVQFKLTGERKLVISAVH
jgi:ferric-dicitrate binding protein FerR (iron transport regulator)